MKNYFNDFFANHCSLVNNSNKFSVNRASINTSMLSSVNIKESDILNILKSLDVIKAHGHDDISIWTLKLSHKSILKPLHLLSENCLANLDISRPMEKANVVSIHNKGDEKLVKNHRPFSLLLANKYLSTSFLMTCLILS